MNWVALVPIKAARLRKSRLAPTLSLADRIALTDVMLSLVLDQLRMCPCIDLIRVLSPATLPGVVTVHDEGRGLNVEIEHARAVIGPVPIVVIHADLPLLSTADIEALLSAAEASGQAIAPDRHLLGTNAVALANDAAVAWRFGPDSLHRHRAGLFAGHAVVHRHGLAADCDTPGDLADALKSGFRFARAAEPRLRA